MADEFPSRSLDKIVIRVPDGMRDRIKEAADKSGRSMNAEIVARLMSSFETDRIIGDYTSEVGEEAAKVANAISIAIAKAKKNKRNVTVRIELDVSTDPVEAQ